MDTGKLIEVLAEAGGPVRRLPNPWRRTAAWLILAMAYVALVVFVMSPRNDLAVKFLQSRFAIEQAAALATGIAAAVAAFATVIPGYDRRILLLPVIPAVVWLGSLGEGCIEQWIRSGLSLQSDWFCLPGILLVGAIPAIAMAAMLRRGAPLAPHLTAALGGLAAAGIGNFGLRLFHAEDASLMVLVWQVGTVVVLTACAGSAGGALLDWRSLTADLRQRIGLARLAGSAARQEAKRVSATMPRSR
jgi:hypothetical protein